MPSSSALSSAPSIDTDSAAFNVGIQRHDARIEESAAECAAAGEPDIPRLRYPLQHNAIALATGQRGP
jgi:hypothetical protein